MDPGPVKPLEGGAPLCWAWRGFCNKGQNLGHNLVIYGLEMQLEKSSSGTGQDQAVTEQGLLWGSPHLQGMCWSLCYKKVIMGALSPGREGEAGTAWGGIALGWVWPVIP